MKVSVLIIDGIPQGKEAEPTQVSHRAKLYDGKYYLLHGTYTNPTEKVYSDCLLASISETEKRGIVTITFHRGNLSQNIGLYKANLFPEHIAYDGFRHKISVGEPVLEMKVDLSINNNVYQFTILNQGLPQSHARFKLDQ